MTDLLIPPQAVAEEQSVLGGVLLAPERMDDVADLLETRDFYTRSHRLIWRAMSVLAEAGDPIDVVTVDSFLRGKGLDQDAGGLGYLATLAKDTPSAANIVAYAKRVREAALKRDLLQGAREIEAAVHATDGRDAAALVDLAERTVLAVADRRGRGGHRSVKDVLVRVVDRIEVLFQSGSGMTGLPTGFVDLDRDTLGFEPGDLVIVAGRPAMGKTSFAMGIAEQVARAGHGVAVFSLEMPAEQLVLRMASGLGSISLQRLRQGKLDDEEWPRFTAAVATLADEPLLIDDTGGLSPAEVRARARRAKKELERDGKELKLIVVDYLQLMQVPDRAANRTEEVSEISRSLKALAKEMGVPVVALSQLNRSLEQRANKRPVLSDLRESGAIEQDADVILFVYRDEVYDPQSPDKGSAEIIIGKQRNGPIGMVRLAFLGQHTRFANMAADCPAGGWGA